MQNKIVDRMVKLEISLCMPCGKVHHECNFYKTKKANRKAFYKWYTMTNDVKIAAHNQQLTTNLN